MNKKELNFRLHTIIIIIGPKLCGKTFLAKKLCKGLVDKISEYKIEPNVQYVCADDIIKYLLSKKSINNFNMLKLDNANNSYDDKFGYLIYYIKLLTSFPTNAHFVIVDMSGLDTELIHCIKEISMLNNYSLDAIIFNYSNINDYYKYVFVNNDYVSHIYKTINNQIKDVHLIAFESDQIFSNKHYIQKTDMEFSYHIDDLMYYKSLHLDSGKKYIIVGDIHECIDEFMNLLQVCGFVIEAGIINHVINENVNTSNMEIICVGDLIDRGGKTVETIEFFYNNICLSPVKIHLIQGNHEHTINKLLNNNFNPDKSNHHLNLHFSSYFVMKNNSNICQKFLHLITIMKPFVYYNNSNDNISRSFYVTHAPCHAQYLGKLDEISIKKQRYSHFDSDKSIHENLEKCAILNSEAYPLHIFGHFSSNECYYGPNNGTNQVLIDTGCVYGNKLTAIVCGKSIMQPYLYSVPSFHIHNNIQKNKQYYINLVAPESECIQQITTTKEKELNYKEMNEISVLNELSETNIRF